MSSDHEASWSRVVPPGQIAADCPTEDERDGQPELVVRCKSSPCSAADRIKSIRSTASAPLKASPKHSAASEKFREQDIKRLLNVKDGGMVDDLWESHPMAPNNSRANANLTWSQRVVRNPFFTFLVTVVIFANAVSIGLETEYSSTEGHPSLPILALIERVFLAVYVVELMLRMHADGTACLKDWWFLFDFSIVGCGVIDWVLELAGGGTLNLSQISALRILRLLKLVRLFRLLRFFKELMLLVNSMVYALRTTMWTWLLLALIIYVFSIAYTKVLGHGYPDVEKMQRDWGSLGRSAFTLSGFVTLEWIESTREFYDLEPAMIVLTLVFVTVTAFALMNVVIAVIVELTIQQAMANSDEMQVRAEEKVKQQASRIIDFFAKADSDHNGELTREEFAAALEEPDTRRVLREQELDGDGLEYLYEQLDINQDGKISLHEFVQGTQQLKGFAKAKRVFEVHCDVIKSSNFTHTKCQALLQGQKKQDEVLLMQRQALELQSRTIAAQSTELQSIRKQQESLVATVEEQTKLLRSLLGVSHGISESELPGTPSTCDLLAGNSTPPSA